VKINRLKILRGKSEAKGLFLTTSHGWKDNIEMNFKGIVCENMDWIKLDQMKFSGVLT
jgi:hypothetical protein